MVFLWGKNNRISRQDQRSVHTCCMTNYKQSQACTCTRTYRVCIFLCGLYVREMNCQCLSTQVECNCGYIGINKLLTRSTCKITWSVEWQPNGEWMIRCWTIVERVLSNCQMWTLNDSLMERMNEWMLSNCQLWTLACTLQSNCSPCTSMLC